MYYIQESSPLYVRNRTAFTGWRVCVCLERLDETRISLDHKKALASSLEKDLWPIWFGQWKIWSFTVFTTKIKLFMLFCIYLKCVLLPSSMHFYCISCMALIFLKIQHYFLYSMLNLELQLNRAYILHKNSPTCLLGIQIWNIAYVKGLHSVELNDMWKSNLSNDAATLARNPFFTFSHHPQLEELCNSQSYWYYLISYLQAVTDCWDSILSLNRAHFSFGIKNTK